MSKPRPLVVKLGGSLLSLDDLPSRWQAWWAHEQPRKAILVFGGGQAVDRLRQCDREQAIAPARVHRLGVRLMDRSARQWRGPLGDLPWLARIEDFSQHPLANRLVALRALEFIDHELALLASVAADRRLPRNASPPLPESWDVTSDSIAARVATLVAGELVLLKSCLPKQRDVQGAAEAGYVDRYFPQAAASLGAVRCVDLRSGSANAADSRASFAECRLAANPTTID